MPGADLHAHTNVSDGTLTPTQLVELAHASGLEALAVTDHDTLGGLAEARGAGARMGVEIVPGVELSVEHEGLDVHLLGYFVDERLDARLAQLRVARERRAEGIVEKLRALGVPIAMADVAREAEGTAALGRPHVARALMRLGAVASVQEAFDRYLADGRPAHVPKAKLSAAESIALVHGAGGVAVLAHPVTLPRERRESIVRAFAELGLDGLECAHSKHAAADVELFRAWARELGLVATGGSDFHGANKPDVSLGSPRLPLDVLNALRARRA